MKTDSIIEDPAPLQTRHRPERFVDRSKQKQQLKQLQENPERNLFLHGPRGTGKTHLALHQIEQLTPQVNTCYIPCKRCSTQYQALKQIYKTVTGEDAEDGHHTAKLQREIQEKTRHTKTVVVLDDIDFLLLKDGDSLLYKLSRTNPENLGIILTSSNTADLSDKIEERTLSSLQPLRIGFEHYTAEQNFNILHQRAQKALKPRTLHKNALSYIVSTTQNTGKALTWLKTAAKQNHSEITENSVKNVKEDAVQNYAEQQLRYFTQHHQLLYQTIEQLIEKQGEPVNTGEIYNRYQDLSENPVSNRRLSDYLKHLELLQLIQAKYHYGGNKGKTREIQLNHSR